MELSSSTVEGNSLPNIVSDIKKEQSEQILETSENKSALETSTNQQGYELTSLGKRKQNKYQNKKRYDKNRKKKKKKNNETDEKKEVDKDGRNASDDEGSSDEQQSKSEQRTNAFRKRKVALIFCYNGLDYQGLQKNPGALSVEDVLEKAIVKAGGISEKNQGNLTKVKWQRACRTDKGVSAAGNVVSLKPPGMVDRINASLPDNIRVLRVQRTVASFHSKNFVDYRVYEYLLPLFAFKTKENANTFKFDEEYRGKVNDLLKLYEGTHNFHNFTQGVKATDAQAMRFMRSIKCSEPFTINGNEMVKVVLIGQSFMIHQIRKMIGLALLLLRHNAPSSIVTSCYSKDRIVIPMAPPQFLLLDRPVYEKYTGKLKKCDSDLDPIDIDALKSREEFKDKHIYEPMLRLDYEHQWMEKFLHKLDHFIPVVNKSVDLYTWLKQENKLEVEETETKADGPDE